MANLSATISRASCFGPLDSLHGVRASYNSADTPSTAQAIISHPQRSSNKNMHATQTRSNHGRSSSLCTANLVHSRSRQCTNFIIECKASSRCGYSSLGTQLWGNQLRRDNSIESERPSGRKAQRPRALFGLGSEAPPEAIPLRPIKTEEDLDAALQTAEDEGHALLIDWMATWCRKCIYLLPKMEKLSGEFQDVKFYMVNVNEVPGALVKRGGIQKMPTIQLWKNKEKVGEVIGGHKAWMVMDEIREMIKNDGTSQGSSS